MQEVVANCDAGTYNAALGYPDNYFYFAWAAADWASFLAGNGAAWFAAGVLGSPGTQRYTVAADCTQTYTLADKLEGTAVHDLDFDVSAGELSGHGYADLLFTVISGAVEAGPPYDVYRPFDVVYRQREGIERFFITDINNPSGSAAAQSTIPLMMDSWSTGAQLGPDGITVTAVTGLNTFNHVPGGANVLYLDGHVSFIKLFADYPVGAKDDAGLGGGNWGILAGEWMAIWTGNGPDAINQF
ncbi:MAG: hypothetical protein HYV27_22030 [Candidatus Hydrogenedentes bacterium]|nr:hypothetical protein [Candidatus Hydrogenedentota bacterium]